MRERTKPTHILRIEVPLDMSDGAPHDYDPVQDALRVALSISRAAFAGYICDSPQVSIDERNQT